LDTPLEFQIGPLLRTSALKLVVAESCTGGLIGHRITNVPGSSDYYLGSITAYAYETKEHLLGVHQDTLVAYGAVSAQTALEMARGARQALGADFGVDHMIGLSVTGIAGPGGGTPTKPVGLVWFGLSTPSGEWTWSHVWRGNRVQNKEYSAEQALKIILAYLQGEIK